jgi:hypothetical protein
VDERGLLEESLIVLLDAKIEPLSFRSRHGKKDCTYNVCQNQVQTGHKAPTGIEPV